MSKYGGGGARRLRIDGLWKLRRKKNKKWRQKTRRK
jgi:hypothetical protein